jgi:hypothetical protein
VQVYIHESDFESFQGKREGKIRGNTAFSDTALSAHNQDLMLDMSQPLSNLCILHPAFLVLILFFRSNIYFFHMMTHPFTRLKNGRISI